MSGGVRGPFWPVDSNALSSSRLSLPDTGAAVSAPPRQAFNTCHNPSADGGWEEGPVSLERHWDLLYPLPEDPGRDVLDPHGQESLGQAASPGAGVMPWGSGLSSLGRTT